MFIASGGLVTVKPLASDGTFVAKYSAGSLTFGLDSGQTLLSEAVYALASFDCIRDCLAGQLEPWIVDDLMPLDTWLIGILAHTDPSFRKYLETYMNSFRSTFAYKRFSSDSLFQSVFGIANIVARVEQAPRQERVEFLKVISASGTSSMLEPFLRKEIDLDEPTPDSPLRRASSSLGAAAASGNLSTFKMLLAAGANAALAIPIFLRDGKGLSPVLFEELLSVMVTKATPPRFPSWNDPILAILWYEKALQACPQAIEILLNHQVFESSLLHGGHGAWFGRSYMYNTIKYDRPSAVKAFLDHGAKADVQIKDLFPESESWDPRPSREISYTWLTLAVERGSASCTDVLVSHGANVLSPDGHGRSALQLAQSNAAAKHPRKLYELPWRTYGLPRLFATDEDDKDVLAVLERALETRLEGSVPELEEDLVIDRLEDQSFAYRECSPA